jgi:serine/threonine protein kinase
MGSQPELPRVIGRYALYDRIASGGMATVHLGRLLGPVGFARTVAIKRLHPQFAQDPEFVSMFLDEARLAARIRHPNVVPTLDVVATVGELFLVMEYVQGESLARLIRLSTARKEHVSPNVVTTILAGVLHGLHAAHEARDERGEPLDIVHRDVSPQNVLVGSDGMARVLDFGVAKAAGRIHTTREGQLKGKIGYMAPEQIGGQVARTTDVYAASVVLWEALTGRRLFSGDNEATVLKLVLDGGAVAPSKFAPDIPPALDALTLRGLSRDPGKRFRTASEMALALEECMTPVPASRIGQWVQAAAGQALNERSERIALIESDSAMNAPVVSSSERLTASDGRVVSKDPPLPSVPIVADGAPATASLPGDEMLLTTQLSSGSISVRSQAPGGTRWGSRRALIGMIAVGGLLAVVALVTMKSEQHPGANEVAPAAAPNPIAPSASSPGSESTATPTSPPMSAPSAAALVAPSAPQPSQSHAMPSSTRPVAPQRPVPATPRPTGSPKPACDPPFYFNAEGNRVFKKECM